MTESSVNPHMFRHVLAIRSSQGQRLHPIERGEAGVHEHSDNAQVLSNHQAGSPVGIRDREAVKAPSRATGLAKHNLLFPVRFGVLGAREWLTQATVSNQTSKHLPVTNRILGKHAFTRIGSPLERFLPR